MQGRCLCGDIKYKVLSTPAEAGVCHCGQCRRQSGHAWAAAHVLDAELQISGDVSWYKSSEKARRGFCAQCGSFLFWKHSEDDHTSFSLGSLEAPTGLTLEKHIFTAEKGDYYTIDDGVPQS